MTIPPIIIRPDRSHLYVDRRTLRRRAQLHPLMEAYIDAMAPSGRPHLREKASRLRPLLDWCQGQNIDPVQARGEDLVRFCAWYWAEARGGDGEPSAYHTKRQTLIIARSWYRWLLQNGHRQDDPAPAALALPPRPGAKPHGSGILRTPRFIHTPLHPLMEAHLEYHNLRGRPCTAKTENLIMRQFSAWCAAHTIDPISMTREQADDYLVWLTNAARTPDGAALSRQTVATRVACLKSWYEWLEIRGSIVCNPVEKLHVRVVKSRVVVHEHLTLQEAIALVQTQAQAVAEVPVGSHTWARRMRLLAAVCVGLATGRRIGGLISIRVEDIDLERQELRIEREKGRTGRVLPVAEWAIAVVRTYLREARPLLVGQVDVPWLFARVLHTEMLSRRGLGVALAELVRQTIAANPDLTELPGKTITWHSLRVSFATMLFGNGCPIRSVNELMLHRCLSTTARYTPIPIEDMLQIWNTAHPRP